MLRCILIAAALGAASASFAQEMPAPPSAEAQKQIAPGEVERKDGRIVASDNCGASRYDHLLGENYAEALNASLVPADTNIVGRPLMTTLEYTPGRLNVVLDVAGRIAAIGCF